MNYNDVINKLKEIKIENNIWIIYLGIIFVSWYANSLEKKYYIFNDKKSKKKYQKIMIGIFSILVIVYFYFLISSCKSVISLNKNSSIKYKKLTYFSFIGSLLIFISGLIFLYIAINDNDLDVELEFD